MSRRATRGQALIIVALLSAVLVGIVGLSIDGGEAAGEQQLVQATADGAALAGAYDASNGSTQAAATTLAVLVVQNNGLAASNLMMSYLNAGGGTVAGPGTTGVAIVQATVTETRRTFFLSALGVPTFRVTATARASTGSSGGPAPSCALCVMNPGGQGNPSLELTRSSQLTVTGAPVIVNSTDSPNLLVRNRAKLIAPSIILAALNQQVSGSATVTPAPVLGATISDPLSAVALPIIAGSKAAYNSPNAGSGSIGPGIYPGITVNGSYSLTMSPGIYVLTGPLTVNSGSLTASGVLIVLACDTYPADCQNANSSGNLTFQGGTVAITAPSSGIYAGMAVMADRTNTDVNQLDAATLTVTGTVYTLMMQAFQSGSGASVTLQSRVIVDSLLVDSSALFQITYQAAQNYGTATTLGLAP